MSHRVRFTTTAAADISSVLAFTLQNFGQVKWLQYQELLATAIDAIADNPMSPASAALAGLPAGYRKMHISRRGRKARHLLCYHVIDDDWVEILRLLHDSMDVRQHLTP